MITLVEGESFLNDATALTLLQVAVAASVQGGLSIGAAMGQFVLLGVGGLGSGMIVAWIVSRLRTVIDDMLVDNTLSLGTPFAAYILAESVHGSGVLAVVVAGLWVGHHSPGRGSGQSRLQTSAVWRFLEFLLEGFVFPAHR